MGTISKLVLLAWLVWLLTQQLQATQKRLTISASTVNARMLKTTMTTVASVKKSFILSSVDDEDAESVGADDGWCVGA